MDNNEIAKLGLQYVNQFTQQVITLSTAVLALSITFTKDIVKNVPHSPLWILKSAWAAFLVSIIFGLWVMMAVTGILTKSNNETLFIVGDTIRFPSTIQVMLFGLGVILMILYGAVSVRKKAGPELDSEMGKD